MGSGRGLGRHFKTDDVVKVCQASPASLKPGPRRLSKDVHCVSIAQEMNKSTDGLAHVNTAPCRQIWQAFCYLCGWLGSWQGAALAAVVVSAALLVHHSWGRGLHQNISLQFDNRSCTALHACCHICNGTPLALLCGGIPLMLQDAPLPEFKLDLSSLAAALAPARPLRPQRTAIKKLQVSQQQMPCS